MNMSKLVSAYMKMRAARSDLAAKFKQEDGALKEKMAVIEGHMLKFLQTNGTDSAKTEAGTFFRQENIQPAAQDWDTFYKWVAENDAFDAITRRINKSFVASYMEENEGATPPGVSVHREYVVRVRKPT